MQSSAFHTTLMISGPSSPPRAQDSTCYYPLWMMPASQPISQNCWGTLNQTEPVWPRDTDHRGDSPAAEPEV